MVPPQPVRASSAQKERNLWYFSQTLRYGHTGFVAREWPMFEMSEIGSRIVADNRENDHCTADPIFVVEERKRIYGMDSDLDDIPIAWMYSDGGEIPDEDAKVAEAYWQENFKEPCGVEDGAAWVGDGRDTLRRVAYLDTWEFVQPFFTQTAADRYIEENRHRMEDPRVYVDSAYRNKEWIAIRKWLAEAVPQQCTRVGPHDGPCNGFPAPGCTPA